MCATRLFRISAANIGPNRLHQNRTVSWLMSIPRSAKRSSTLRSDSGYLTYIITTRRMTSGELLKYRNGLLMSQAYHGQRRPLAFGLTEPAGVEPVIAMGRQPHHPPLSERFEKAPEAPKDPTPVEAAAHRLKTPAGRALYALRKQTPEPVFGIIKSALGFRQFSLRGLENVRGEWSLVTTARNLKRIFVLNPAC